MKKMFNKAVLNGTTVMGDGLTYPRIPNVYTGDNEGGYQRGDMMDANAVVEMIKELTDTGKITIEELQNLINEEIQERVEGDQNQQRYTDEKIKNLIGTSPETLDTLKEIADALGEDPDFAANVWNKITELTTKHNEDVQELQDAITSGFENIDFTPYVKKTDVVTNTTNGLMLASDKVKLDSFDEALTEISQQIAEKANNVDIPNHMSFVSNGWDKDVIHCSLYKSNGEWLFGDEIYLFNNKTSVKLNTKNDGNTYIMANLNVSPSDNNLLKVDGDGYCSVIIPNATTSKEGLMSKEDKTKLDSLKNYTLPAATNNTLGGVKVPTNIFTGSKNIKNHICINNGEVGANFELSYNKSNKRINFIIRTTSGGGVIDSITQSIDCTDFIKDGMLESANVEVNPEGHDAGTYIKLVFNTDAGKDPVYINVSDLIHEYTAGGGINISEGVISTTPISIKTEKFSFVNSGSHQPTYNYSGVTIYDDRYISGTKYGIAFDEADIKPRTTITSPDGVRTVCFALDQSVRRKIETAITSISVNNIGQVNTNGAVNLTIPNASITENGLMSKEDKAKLDSQPTIKASNATGVTDDDYVVIKKSELNSILSRLSALENKA